MIHASVMGVAERRRFRMRMNSALCRVAALAAMCVGAAGAQQPAPADANGGSQVQSGVHALSPSVDLLSDTQGVDFQPYMKLILSKIDGQWTPLLPADARLNPGETQIRFTINPDGTIAAMHLEGSSQNEALNRAAWGSITGVGHFPALPKDFHGQNLELRIHFRVNG
jgi:TonB family protein